MPENENNENNDSQQNPIGDAAPPRRRRRAVSRPTGTPQGAEGVETVIPVEAAATAAVAAAPVEEPAAEKPVRARRTRKRAESPVTSPAAETPAVEETPVAAAAPVEEPAAEKPVRARRTRKRAEAPVVEETPAVEETPVVAAAPVEEPAAEKPVRARRTRKRAESPVTSPVVEEPAVEEPVAEEEPTEETPAAPAPAEQPAPVEEHHAEAPRARRRAVRPATAIFQAPVFQEPAAYVAPAQAAPAAAPAAPAAEPKAATKAAPASKAAPAAEPKAAAKAVPAASESDDEYEYSGVGRRRRGGRAAVRVTPPSRPARGAAEPKAAAAAAAAPAPAPAPAPVAPEQPVEAVAPAQGPEQEADWEEDGRPSSRRRRRGGRRRRRGEAEEFETEGQELEQPAAAVTEAVEADTEAEEEDEDDLANGLASSRRRRRRRRRSGETGGEVAEPAAEDGVRTVVKVREPRRRSTEPSFDPDEVQSIKGSTRLEAKKQRRREGRELGRRRVPIITEAEFLARRESVERVMVVRQNGERTQIGVLEDGVLVEHYVNKEQATSYVGNVYLGKVQNVLPSMEAAFVDIGKGRNAVLYAGEVNFGQLGHSGPRRIESVLKSGQSVLVQVSKDPIGHKGARLTSQISLPGRYLVYVPEGSMTGISRKLPENERARLKQILKKIVPDDAGVIVRTAAEGASEEELTRDVQRLQAQWEEIQKKAASGNAPTLLYGEPDMTVRVVRDIFNEDFTKVIVSGNEAWTTIHDYVGGVAPDLVDRLQKWTSNVDVFATYRIDEQLMKALDRKVWLPSGGSLVIDRTEAMVVVDVNTGKFVGQGGNLEETVTRNNIEAAEEIVRQLRLRDLGGIIVIDFIDMVLESNRDLVLRRLLECLGRDRTKHQVAEVTSLGLVQMTRKRVGQGLLESFSESCVHCNGRGVIVHMEQPTAPGGGGGPVGTAGEAAGAGTGKRRRRGKGGVGHEEPQPHLIEDESGADHEHEEFELIAPEAPAAQRVEAPVVEEEPAAEEAVEAPVAEQPSLVEIAPVATPAAGRTRRRAVRKATASAGAPDEAEIVVLQSRAEAVVEAALAAAAPAPAVEVPAAEAPVVEQEPAVEQAPVEQPEAEEAAAEEPAPKKRAPRKAAAKKTAAAVKKTTTTAKKTTARKTATKRTSAAAKKAAAAEGDSAAE
ncbi:Rne/Rng family ribonuclease [Kitasatospora sp. NBC_01266]|uniref:Rne/Rng family ribonuclease n=1 Tax=Kitasatospora sp. NBC_01266 TaxID=2903572 RepID=UPI002E2EA739|nr:Rne/Rng family ribonuclease [Kitasatospora sp. NBC_01266]